MSFFVIGQLLFYSEKTTCTEYGLWTITAGLSQSFELPVAFDLHSPNRLVLKSTVHVFKNSFSSYQKTVNDTTVAEVSHQLLNISKRAREYSDPLDVVYGAEVVEKLAQVIGRDQVVSLV